MDDEYIALDDYRKLLELFTVTMDAQTGWLRALAAQLGEMEDGEDIGPFVAHVQKRLDSLIEMMRTLHDGGVFDIGSAD